jgi:hypothetical protein
MVGGDMVIVQRIVVRWTKQGRGADQAARRREIPSAFPLPPMPDEPLVLHDVVADEESVYMPASKIDGRSLPAQLVGLRFDEVAGSKLRVSRSQVWSSYPHNRRPAQLFLLEPGEQVRYRANFRFSGYGTDWYYEQWTVNIAFDARQTDLFLSEEFNQDRDERVSLYGGRH